MAVHQFRGSFVTEHQDACAESQLAIEVDERGQAPPSTDFHSTIIGHQVEDSSFHFLDNDRSVYDPFGERRDEGLSGASRLPSEAMFVLPGDRKLVELVHAGFAALLGVLGTLGSLALVVLRV